MGKVSSADKMRIQTLCEQGYGAKRIVAAYPFKNWKLMTVKNICRKIDSRGSATECEAGNGRPKSARSVANVDRVEELICSQEEQSGQHFSTREIAAELGISDRSYCEEGSPPQCVSPGTSPSPQRQHKTKVTALFHGSASSTQCSWRDTWKTFLPKPSCQQPEWQSLGGRQESWRQSWTSSRRAWEVCATCDGFSWRVSAAMDGSTLLTRLLKWILHTTLAVSFPVSQSCWQLHSIASWRLYLSAKWCTSTHSSCHAELATNQLSRFHWQRPVASKFIRLEYPGLPRLGSDVGRLSQAPSKTEDNHRTQGNTAGDLGQPTSRPDRQGCETVFKTL